MHANKKIIHSLFIPLLVLLLVGCRDTSEPVGFVVEPAFAQRQQLSPVANRFEQPTFQGPTAVDSAIELSQNYAVLSEEASILRLKNQNLITENRNLKDSLATSQAELQQAQKELAEANELLQEMLIELNNWKTDVIGFRGEMRGAEKAQLEALLKILEILGAEPNTEPIHGETSSQEQTAALEPSNDTATTEILSNKPAPSKSQEKSILGESNG